MHQSSSGRIKIRIRKQTKESKYHIIIIVIINLLFQIILNFFNKTKNDENQELREKLSEIISNTEEMEMTE